MTPAEIDRCIQIGHQEDTEGHPIIHEYLLIREGQAFAVEVVGIPLHPSLEDFKKYTNPPFAIPGRMLENPDEVCKFLLSTPLEILTPHLVAENLPTETE